MFITKPVDQVNYEVLEDAKIPYEIRYARSIDDIENLWKELNPPDVFMQYDFLHALEVSPPSRFNYRYVLLCDSDIPVAAFYYQYKWIDYTASLGLDKKVNYSTWQESVKHQTKIKIANLLKSYVLVNGNMTITGVPGFYFKNSQDFDTYVVEKVASLVREKLVKENVKIRATIIKDLNPKVQFHASSQFNRFTFQPNMVVPIRDEWQSFDDYLIDLKSKYRVKARKCKSIATPIIKKELNEDELSHYKNVMNVLYQNVADNADFNLFLLSPDYFLTLKNHLKENMIILGYFHGGDMVGFSTLIKNGTDTDAHFLGYDSDVNKKHSLYQNMLYDMIELSINLKATRLVLSRTAMAIKSSVGAIPYDLDVYFDSNSSILNQILKYASRLLEPKADWIQRKPFKESSY